MDWTSVLTSLSVTVFVVTAEGSSRFNSRLHKNRRERGVFHLCAIEEALTIIEQTVRQTGVATVATQHTPVRRQLPASTLGLEPGVTKRVVEWQEYSQCVHTSYTMAGSQI